MTLFLNILRGLLVIICIVVACGTISDLSNSNSAVQQAAAAAIGATSVIIPYIILKAIEGLFPNN